jgi:hypothetical protein
MKFLSFIKVLNEVCCNPWNMCHLIGLISFIYWFWFIKHGTFICGSWVAVFYSWKLSSEITFVHYDSFHKSSFIFKFIKNKSFDLIWLVSFMRIYHIYSHNIYLLNLILWMLWSSIIVHPLKFIYWLLVYIVQNTFQAFNLKAFQLSTCKNWTQT